MWKKLLLALATGRSFWINDSWNWTKKDRPFSWLCLHHDGLLAFVFVLLPCMLDQRAINVWLIASSHSLYKKTRYTFYSLVVRCKYVLFLASFLFSSDYPTCMVSRAIWKCFKSEFIRQLLRKNVLCTRCCSVQSPDKQVWIYITNDSNQ